MVTLEMPWKRKNLSEIWTWPQLLFVNFYGFWAEEASTKLRRQLLKYLRVISFATVVLANISILIALILQFAEGAIAQNMATVYVFIESVVGVYKTSEIMKHRKSYKRIMEILAELTNEISHPEDDNLFRTKMYRMWIVFMIYITISLADALHWLIGPLFDTLRTGEKTVIFDAWPNLMNNWTQYIFTYLSQFWASSIFGFNVSFFTCLHISVSQYILCHFAIFRKNLERLHLRGNEEDTIKLKKIIRKHSKLLESCKDLKVATEGVLIVETVTIVLTLCSGVFVMTMSEDVKLLNIIDSQVLMIMIVFSACWFSNEITFQSENVRTSAYKSDWIEGSLNQKKILLNLTTRTMIAVKFGGFMQLDLNTLITVMKATFSYYNFLVAVITTSVPT